MPGALDRYGAGSSALSEPTLRSYTPTLRERLSYWLNQNFLGDSRQGQERANVLASALDFTPVGLATGMYDAGRSLGEGNVLAGIATAALAGLPIPAKGLKKTIKAYHGSPHDFERFDMSKIGTGEGAQAYGHGLYFAENEDVAKGYRDTLARRNDEITWDGKRLATSRDYYAIGDSLERDDWRLSKAFDHFVKEPGTTGARLQKLRDWYRDQPDMMTAIGTLEQRVTAKPAKGSMYEVEIDADPDQFLDWDKPLEGEAREAAFSALQRSLPNNQTLARYIASERPGRDVYGTLTRGEYYPHLVLHDEGALFASQALREAGIPGIKYLDAGSRGAGEGSRNYVLFRDDIIKILRKYGVASIAALPPAVQAAISQTYGVTAEDEPTTY